MFYWLVLFISILTLVLYNWVYPFTILFHYILGPFAYGVSRFKLTFMLLFYAVSSVIMLLPERPLFVGARIFLPAAFFLSTGLGLLAGLASYLSLAQRLALPLGKYSYHFKDGLLSANYLFHIHTSKLPLYYFCRLTGLERLVRGNFDNGSVFAEQVAPWLVMVIGFSALTALIVALLLLKPTIMKWPKNNRPLILIIFIFAAAHTIKTIIDGGIFSYDLWPSLIILHLLLVSSDPLVLGESFRRWRAGYFALLAGYLLVVSYYSFNEAFLQIPIGVTFIISVFTLLFSPLFNPRHRWQTGALALVVIFAYLSGHGFNNLTTLFSRLPAGSRVIQFNYTDRQAGIDDWSVKMAGRQLGDIYRKLGDNPLRNRRVAIIEKDRNKYTGSIFWLRILSRREAKLYSNELIQIQEIAPLREKGTYLVKMAFNPKIAPALWDRKANIILQNNRFSLYFLLNDFLCRGGVSEYVIVPYYFFNTGSLE